MWVMEKQPKCDINIRGKLYEITFQPDLFDRFGQIGEQSTQHRVCVTWGKVEAALSGQEFFPIRLSVHQRSDTPSRSPSYLAWENEHIRM